MINRFLFLSLLMASVVPANAAVPVALENPSFENGLTGWTVQKGDGMFSASPKAASMGESGLWIDDNSEKAGVLVSSPVPVIENHIYEFSLWGRMESASPNTNVKLEFYGADGRVLKAVPVQGSWGGASVKYGYGFMSYGSKSGAPVGAKMLRIVIETWGRATGITSMDDFSLDDVTDGKSAEVPVDALLAVAKAAKAAGKPMPKIVVKTDDLKQVNDRIYPKWQKLADFAQQRKIKVGIGIVFQSLEQDAPKYVAWIKNLHSTGLFEFWNHGYDHAEWKEGDKTLQEFKGSTYEHQKQHLTRSNQLAKEKLGITMRSFGAPFNSVDDTARKVLSEDPDIQVVMFEDKVEGKVALPRNFAVNIENPTFVANYPKFVEGYVHNLQAPVFVIQGHPNNWDDNRWNNFVQIVDFLQAQGAEFAFASDFAPKAKP